MQAEIIDKDGRRRLATKGGMLKDGETLRVPFEMMDAQQREIAQEARRLVDAASHRPGFRGSASTAAADAYSDAGRTLCDAWRNPDAAPQPTVTERQPTGDARQSAFEAEGARVRDAWRSAA